jgi:DNA-binding FrmR family transcriptional regulator
MSSEEAGHRLSDKHRLRSRARRIEGQAAGVVRMIEQERPCAELLQQIAALTAAADKLAVLLIEDHMLDRANSGDVGPEQLTSEVGALLRRLMRR